MAIAEAIVFPCPRCQSASLTLSAEHGQLRCFFCAAEVEATMFPALLRPGRKLGADVDVISDEASCFFHPQWVAALACGRCGRFLCNLCRIPWAGSDLCPPCVELATQAGPAEALPSSRFHYDSLALAVSAVPIFFAFFTFLTAPLSLGLAAFTFRRECSVAPRMKYRFPLAILLALAQITTWIILLVSAFRDNAHS